MHKYSAYGDGYHFGQTFVAFFFEAGASYESLIHKEII